MAVVERRTGEGALRRREGSSLSDRDVRPRGDPSDYNLIGGNSLLRRRRRVFLFADLLVRAGVQPLRIRSPIAIGPPCSLHVCELEPRRPPPPCDSVFSGDDRGGELPYRGVSC